jgi:hypothetical protein
VRLARKRGAPTASTATFTWALAKRSPLFCTSTSPRMHLHSSGQTFVAMALHTMAGGLALLFHGGCIEHDGWARLVALRLSGGMVAPCCKTPRLETRLPRLPCKVCTVWPTLPVEVPIASHCKGHTFGEHNAFKTDSADLATFYHASLLNDWLNVGSAGGASFATHCLTVFAHVNIAPMSSSKMRSA